jgi:hypothetical protein
MDGMKDKTTTTLTVRKLRKLVAAAMNYGMEKIERPDDVDGDVSEEDDEDAEDVVDLEADRNAAPTKGRGCGRGGAGRGAPRGGRRASRLGTGGGRKRAAAADKLKASQTKKAKTTRG